MRVKFRFASTLLVAAAVAAGGCGDDPVDDTSADDTPGDTSTSNPDDDTSGNDYSPALTKSPNILFILTDDQDRMSLGAYGNTECSTPNLDKLASEGMLVTGAYQMGSTNGAVSIASRTMIMTGCNVWSMSEVRTNMNTYPNNAGNMDVVVVDSPEYYSLPALFSRAGYETFRTCKSGNSYNPANYLFDYRYERICRDDNDEDYSSKWHADLVIDYFNSRAEISSDDEKKPFFVYLGFSLPHDPRNGRDDLLAKYGAENVDEPTTLSDKMPSLPISWLPEKPFEQGDVNLRDEIAVEGVMTRRDVVTIRNELGKEYACIDNLDTQIGRVLDALEAAGELDNTYIFYTADHGIAVGKHAYMGKQNLYEHTFRVPFIVKGPTIPQGEEVEGNFYLMDMVPTLCSFANIEIPATAEGVSAKEVLEGKQDRVRDVLYGAYAGGTKPGIRCVKRGDWKLVKYDVLDGTVRETQLFNITENPEELTIEHHDPAVIAQTGYTPTAMQVDLAEDPAYADVLAEMEALLVEQMALHNDQYTLWDQE